MPHKQEVRSLDPKNPRKTKTDAASSANPLEEETVNPLSKVASQNSQNAQPVFTKRPCLEVYSGESIIKKMPDINLETHMHMYT